MHVHSLTNKLVPKYPTSLPTENSSLAKALPGAKTALPKVATKVS
jgi:hypothetical protein